MPTPKPDLVITVHGIRTFGGWQERLEKMVVARATDRKVEVANYKYGYFSVLAFLLPFLRWLVVRSFAKELKVLSADRERVDIVGHSFGTHIIGWALMSLRRDPKVQVHTVILAGSVLRGGFPWRDLLGSTVKRVVNDCGSSPA